jgi:hypothetical protein
MLELPCVPNAVYRSKEEAARAPRSDFELCRDTVDGYLFERKNSLAIYERFAYQNDQSSSALFRDHMRMVAGALLERVGPKAAVCEVGCGKGAFLTTLTEVGFESVMGFDAAYQGADPRIKARYLSSHDTPLQSDVIVLRHVLEHIPNPRLFLDDLVHLNGRPPLLLVEVPDFQWLVEGGNLWDLTLEHVNYFDQESLKRTVCTSSVDRCFGDQYLLAFSENLTTRPRSPSTGQKSQEVVVPQLEERFLSLLWNVEQRIGSNRWWIWGAATKGVLIDFHARRLRAELAARMAGLIDVSDAKQGRYAACTGSPILSPSEFSEQMSEDDVMLVANPNYAVEIEGTMARLGRTCKVLTTA